MYGTCSCFYWYTVVYLIICVYIFIYISTTIWDNDDKGCHLIWGGDGNVTGYDIDGIVPESRVITVFEK